MHSMIDKQALINSITAELQQQLETAQQAVAMAADTATHSETVAKSKYDTFGLEASYLAHGQQQRLLSLQEDILRLQSLSQRQLLHTQSPTVVSLGCAVMLEDEEEQQHWFFIAPAAGGLIIEYQELNITVITESAPLAQRLLGKSLDDEILQHSQPRYISAIY